VGGSSFVSWPQTGQYALPVVAPHVLSPVVDDYVIAGTLEVFHQIRANFLLGLSVINRDEPSDKIIRPE
jgi:hypothetical protein